MSKIIDIKKFRELHGLTQRELAERCGVTLRTVQNWEMGRTIPDSAMRLMQLIENEGETISSSAADDAVSVAGNGNNNVNSKVNVNSSRTIDKAIDEISEMRKLVQKRDEQIDRLISVIEKITDKTEVSR